MTSFEAAYGAVRLFEHPLYQHVWRSVRAAANSKCGEMDCKPHLLDVGGRRSNYTIGVPARVTVTELPRKDESQRKLDLGATDELARKVLSRRSNLDRYIFDNMTCTEVEPDSVDIVTAIEVLEHVADDGAFLTGVARVLRRDGAFVMTTPNGDYIPIPYPQHVRHYRRHQLEQLLRGYFHKVEVSYRVNGDRLFKAGRHRWSARTPLRTIGSMLAFGAADKLERVGYGGDGPHGKLHLFAYCSQPRS